MKYDKKIWEGEIPHSYSRGEPSSHAQSPNAKTQAMSSTRQEIIKVLSKAVSVAFFRCSARDGKLQKIAALSPINKKPALPDMICFTFTSFAHMKVASAIVAFMLAGHALASKESSFPCAIIRLCFS